MPGFDYVTFVEYNNWANGRLLDTAEQLSEAELRSGTLSKGNAFETLRHVLDVEWSWRMACQDLPAKTELWLIEPLEDLAAVRAYWEAEGQRLLTLVRSLSEADLERDVLAEWMSKPVKAKHIIIHIVNHATNHRSELGWFFTGLGHSPGDIDYMEYVMGRQG